MNASEQEKEARKQAGKVGAREAHEKYTEDEVEAMTAEEKQECVEKGRQGYRTWMRKEFTDLEKR